MALMIKLSSFYPFSKLLRVTQEFHEEKAFVKMKSLTFEQNFDFEYKDVGEISDTFVANNSQLIFSFVVLLIVSGVLVIFCRPIYANPVLLRSAQILYVGALLLHLTAFKKSWWIFISDKKENTLTYVRQTRTNRDRIQQAIELIKNKAKNVREVSAADPFPTEKPVFEYSYYDLAEMMKTTDRFYEDKIIGIEKTLFGEHAYVIEYNQLSGNVHREKQGGDITFSTYIYLLIEAMILGFVYGFPELGIGFPLFLRYFALALGILIPLSWLLGLQKREVIKLYYKNERFSYHAHVNRNDKAKVEEIIKFVQSRVSPATTNELLKEPA
jgi:hypothetical protein